MISRGLMASRGLPKEGSKYSDVQIYLRESQAILGAGLVPRCRTGESFGVLESLLALLAG